MKKDYNGVVERIKNRIRPEQRIFIKKNLNISHQVTTYLEQHGWTQKEFAKRLGKEPSEVSKWLSGLHNITLQSISKMEAVLGDDVILTPLEACDKYKKIQYEYIVLKVYAHPNEDSTESDIHYSEHATLEIEPTNQKVA